MTLNKKIAEIAIKKAANIAIRKIRKKNGDQVVGIGISWLWMLPKTHKFQICAVRHDAHYDAVEVLFGKKSITQLPTEPKDYRDHVLTAIHEFTAQNISVFDFIKRADQVFYEQCIQIAKSHQSVWLRLQAELYYQIVNLWSDLKFKTYQEWGAYEKNSSNNSILH